MGRSADVPRIEGRSIGAGDDLGCVILHVDMDAFFASVEIRRRPELRGRPVIVGGGKRGVVAAASYPARVFGVRSAMPIGQALRLCPTAIVLPPDRAQYSAASADVMSILKDFTPSIEPLSLDEAFLDVSGAERIYGSPKFIAAAIRARVSSELGLTCSVGVAGAKFVAKLASARCKPDGLLVVPAEATLQFLHPLPVTVLAGVGPSTAAPLHRLGIRTVADLAGTPLNVLARAVGANAAGHLNALALGRDDRQVTPRAREQSISADRTMETDLVRHADVRLELLRAADELSRRLRSRELLTQRIGIKVRFADFTTVTRVRTLDHGTDSMKVLHVLGCELYDDLALDKPRIRLVGLKCERLVEQRKAHEQLCLEFGLSDKTPSPARQVHAAADSVVDAANARFGDGAVVRAALLGRRSRSGSSPDQG